jgi:hypothetical protein
MGAWGKLPWENDGAGDWFEDLFAKTKFAQHIENTLRLSVENSHEEIRAAASILLFLGRDYIWPIQNLNEHLGLAADQLEKIANLAEIAETPELPEEIRVEAQELRSRIKTPVTSQHSQASKKKWWQFPK